MKVSSSNPLTTIEDIKAFFKANEVPIYFISATNFNLLDLEEWVANFKFICHIDCFEGKHEHVFSPKNEVPHDEFQSIEDINNYLLQHPEVKQYIQSRSHNGNAGKALFLMFDEKTEILAKALGLEVCFPSAQLRAYLDNKVNTNRIADKAGVACVPNILSPVLSYKHLSEISIQLGTDLVIQTPYGDSGHTTFFISNEKEFDAHKTEILNEAEVKIMKRINCFGTAIEGCVTQHGTLVAPLMTELIGFKALTPYKGGWCGNELFANAFNADIRNKAKKYTQQFGDQLRKEGYVGYFELDFLIDKDTEDVYLGELNPRVSGISYLTNHGLYAQKDVPMFLFHLLEWMQVPYQIDVQALTDRWSNSENMDSWSQLVIKHTRPSLELAIKAPETGIWEMKKNGNIQLLNWEGQNKKVKDDNEAFYLQITQKDGYLYEGADLGILVMKGRLMSDGFELSERAKRWIRAIRGQYKSHMIDPGILDENDLLEENGFKML